jgi:peroxiredoxin
LNQGGLRVPRAEFPIQKGHTIIVGVSKDSIESHKKFAEKFKLPYILLSDPKSEVMKKYGAFGKKNDVRQRSAGHHSLNGCSWTGG